MSTQTKTLADFITDNGITMQVQRVPMRPDAEPKDWPGASHWIVTLRKGGHGTGKGPETGCMSFFYSMGSAHNGAPSNESVLDSIASDASSVESARSFEDWCGDLGYDTDSRKAERIHDACRKIRDELRDMLDDAEAFEELLYNVERL